MGCFDTILVNCPGCGKSNEIQSKAGNCLLDTFELDKAPDVIKSDLNGERIVCKTCGAVYRIVTSTESHVVFEQSPKDLSKP